MLIFKPLATIFLFMLLALAFSSVSLAQDEEDDFFDDDDDFFFFEEEENDSEEIADPLESFNRSMFSFNDKVYRKVFKPVAVAYRVIPEPVRISVTNVIDNLETPISSVNALLQLDLKNTVTEASRFLINSTLGLLGIFDPATHLGLLKDDEDFGQTLGRYGISHGFYLVIPFFGSSSLRDGLGSIASNLNLNPVLDGLNQADFIGIKLVDAETTISIDKDTYEAFYDSALDPYIFFRSAYIQSRDAKVKQ